MNRFPYRSFPKADGTGPTRPMPYLDVVLKGPTGFTLRAEMLVELGRRGELPSTSVG